MPAFVLLFVGIATCAVVIWVALSSRQYSDFVMWHESARAFLEGRDLYFSDVTRPGWRNMNPPHFVVLISPLGWLPVRDALILWWAITGAAMAGCVHLWNRVLPPGLAITVFAILLASVAGYGNVRFANQSWIAAWVVTWAWLRWRDGRRLSGSAMLGLVASIKVFVLIFAPYFVWKRRWRELAAFAGAGTASVDTQNRPLMDS